MRKFNEIVEKYSLQYWFFQVYIHILLPVISKNALKTIIKKEILYEKGFYSG
jgi:hypothetical protein